MPMFGSTSRGKSGAASAPEKEDTVASKGAKFKEDADCGAACSDPSNDESISRETPPNKACQTYIPENALHYYLEWKSPPP